jgi:hypothetical protein
MPLFRRAAVAAAFAVVFTAAEARAQCWNVCTESTRCDRACRDGGQWTTCGDYGICRPSGCQPNYQPISSQLNAVFPVDYPSTCDEIAAYANVFHDVAGCPGSEDYTACSYGRIHTHGYGGCCADVYCGGSGPCSPYFTEGGKETSGGASHEEDGTSWRDVASPAAVQNAAFCPAKKS